MTKPEFSLGQVVATPGALRALQEAGHRLRFSPWTGTSPGIGATWTRTTGGQTTKPSCSGERLLSAYRTLLGVKLWVIT